MAPHFSYCILAPVSEIELLTTLLYDDSAKIIFFFISPRSFLHISTIFPERKTINLKKTSYGEELSLQYKYRFHGNKMFKHWPWILHQFRVEVQQLHHGWAEKRARSGNSGLCPKSSCPECPSAHEVSAMIKGRSGEMQGLLNVWQPIPPELKNCRPLLKTVCWSNKLRPIRAWTMTWSTPEN